MVKNLTALNKYPTAHLRCAMDPEWGLSQVIHRLMSKMKEKPKFEWVRSHQDDDPDVDITKLSVGIKINIKADTLATQGINRLESNQRMSIDLSLEVLLHQRDRNITRYYKVSMRGNIQLLVMEKYY